jgi:hypothetical protein
MSTEKSPAHNSAADLRKRAGIVLFNHEANERAPTAWFQALPATRRASIQRGLARYAAELTRKARTADRREGRRHV